MRRPLSKLLQCVLLTLMFITILPNNVIAENENAYAYSEDESGNKTYYNSLNEAMNASRSGLTIIMNKEWQITSAIDIVEGTTSKIEMNGYAIRRVDSRTGMGHSGEVFTLHANSKLYLYGNLKSNTRFTFKRVSSSSNTEESITSGGLVTGGYTFNGGAVYMKSKAKLYLENVALAGNESWNTGGGVFVNSEDCEIFMNNAHIDYNYSRTSGGGIFSDADGTHIYMNNNSSISHNSANNSGYGGGICFNYSWFSINGDGTSFIDYNTAPKNGGGIMVRNRTFGSNSGEIKGVNISNNKATAGGGLYIDQHNIKVINCTFSSNTSYEDGGGVYNNGKNRFEDVSFYNNSANYTDYLNQWCYGGAMYCTKYYDITLSGKIIACNNTAMVGVNGDVDFIDPETGAFGVNGWEEDNIFLNGNSAISTYAYINADNIDPSSLIGITPGSTAENVLLVKNLDSYTYGETIFLDDGTRFHMSYDETNKQLWARKDGTKYKVYIDGVEYGEYNYKEYVSLDSSKIDNKILEHWQANDFYISESKNNAINFYMPARNLHLTRYTYDGLSDVTLKTEALKVGSNFPKKAYLSFSLVNSLDNTSTDYTYYYDIGWVYKDENGNWVDVDTKNEVVEYNKSYRLKATIPANLGQKVAFSKDVDYRYHFMTIYGSNSDKVSGYINSYTINDDGSISIIGIGQDMPRRVFSVKEQYVYVNEGSSIEEFKSLLPKTAVAYNIDDLSQTDTAEFNDISDDELNKLLDDNDTIKKITDNALGKIALSLPIKQRDGIKYAKDSVNLVVYVIPKKEVVKTNITSVDDVTIKAFVGITIDSLCDLIPTTAKAIGEDNSIWLLNVTDTRQEMVNKLSSIVDENGRVKLPEDGKSPVFSLNLALSLNDSSKAIFDSDKYKFNVKIELDSDGTIDPVAILSTPTLSIDSGTYDSSKLIDGSLVIKVTTASENETVSYQIDDGQIKTGSTISLAALDNDSVTYSLTVWSSKDGFIDSSKRTYSFTINNIYPTLKAIKLDKISATYLNSDLNVGVIANEENATIKYQITKDGIKGDVIEGSSFVLEKINGSKIIYEVEVWASKKGYNDSIKSYYRYVLDSTGVPKDVVSSPIIDLDAGTYTRYDSDNKLVDGNLILNVSCDTSDALIYYQIDDGETKLLDGNTITLDGVDKESKAYTLKLWAEKDNYESSAVISYSFIIDNTYRTLKTPSVNKAAGVYWHKELDNLNLVITLSSEEDVTYKYEIDGIEYIGNTITLKGEYDSKKQYSVSFWASKDGYNDSAKLTYTYILDNTLDKLNKPVLDITGGTYSKYDSDCKLDSNGNLNITVNEHYSIKDVTINYQIDDEEIKTISSGETIKLSGEVGKKIYHTLTVWASKDDYKESTHTTYEYLIDNTLQKTSAPNVSLKAGTYEYSDNDTNKDFDTNGNLLVNLSSDSTIHYQIDGEDEKTCNNSCTVLIASAKGLKQAHTLKVWASKDGYSDSDKISYTYIIDKTSFVLDSPSLSPDDSLSFSRDDIDKYAYLESLIDGTLNLKLSASASKGTIYYKYSYFEDDEIKWTNESKYEDSIVLSTSYGDSQLFEVVVYAKDGDMLSNSKSYVYYVDNSDKILHNITIKAIDALGNGLNFTGSSHCEDGMPKIVDAITSSGYEFVTWEKLPEGCFNKLTDREISIDKVNDDITLTAIYKKVIEHLDVNISDIVVGSALPNDLTSIMVNNGFGSDIDISSYFDVSNMSWNSDDSKALYSTTYTLTLPIKDNFLDLFTLSDDLKVKGASNVFLSQISVEDKVANYLNIVFPKTGDNPYPDREEELSYTLQEVFALDDIELSYEDALYCFNNNYWDLPLYVNMLFKDNNTNEEIYYHSDITWDSVKFDINNYSGQEIIVTGAYDLPSYISNRDEFDKKLTIKIKVKAKQGYVPDKVIEESLDKAVTCEEYMKSKDWTWSESKKACVYKVSNTSSNE